jgi:hypothetical protein
MNSSGIAKPQSEMPNIDNGNDWAAVYGNIPIYSLDGTLLGLVGSKVKKKTEEEGEIVPTTSPNMNIVAADNARVFRMGWTRDTESPFD